MVLKKISPSPTDENFRKHVKELIDSAQKEILVIAGELGSYRFPDLKWAMKRALQRGVKIRIYASRPNQTIINGLLARGCQIYVGEEIKDHYLIVDAKSWVHSKPHPPILGVRKGETNVNEPQKAKKLVTQFNQLISKAKPKKTTQWNQDPLWNALQNPPDWGIKTDSSRLEEELP
jgi:phosphatidylserine/phosphatidylglycerophosphate/cardiolipin synthase-like enzyme